MHVSTVWLTYTHTPTYIYRERERKTSFIHTEKHSSAIFGRIAKISVIYLFCGRLCTLEHCRIEQNIISFSCWFNDEWDVVLVKSVFLLVDIQQTKRNETKRTISFFFSRKKKVNFTPKWNENVKKKPEDRNKNKPISPINFATRTTFVSVYSILFFRVAFFVSSSSFKRNFFL